MVMRKQKSKKGNMKGQRGIMHWTTPVLAKGLRVSLRRR